MVLSIQVITVIRVGAPTEEIINRVIDIILIPEQIGTRIQTTRILSNGVTDASTRKNEAVTIKVKQSSLMMNSLHAFFFCCYLKKNEFLEHYSIVSLFALTKCLCSNCYLWNSLRWPIYDINSVDNTKLPCYTLTPTQHHSFFRNLPLLFIRLFIILAN